MKILFIADIHIKLGQKNVPKSWATDRYTLFIKEINELEKEVDLIVLGGDIYDRVPSLEEENIYWSLVKSLNTDTLIFTGNHESETKTRSFFNHIINPTNWINPKVRIITEITNSNSLGIEGSPFYIVPYEFIKDKKMWDSLDPLPVMTHVRGEIPPHVKPEIPLEWLEKFPIVFAGDLHSHKNTQANIVYPGSPMTTSFHRNETSGANGYLIIDTDDWSWEWHDFELPQLIRKTVSNPDDMVPTEYHHTIYELEGSMDELAGKVDSELLDKKIVKRSSDVAMKMEESMTLEEELEQYLKTILEVKDVDNIMGIYYEFNKV